MDDNYLNEEAAIERELARLDDPIDMDDDSSEEAMDDIRREEEYEHETYRHYSGDYT